MEDYLMSNDFNKRRKSKRVLLFLSINLLLLFLFSGCDMEKTRDDTDGKQITVNPTEALIEPSKAIGSDETENRVEPKFEDFIIMEEFFKDYTFDISYDEKLEFYERTYTIQGAYDMNGDGEDDKIDALLKADYQEGSYIEVNGNRLVIDYCNPSGEIQMIDLNNKDSFTEIAVFDNGPSADPTLMFFRYDGSEVSFLGSIDQYALMDGQGRFISSFHLTQYFNPQFFSAWGEFEDGEYVLTNHDVEQYIGKTFDVNGAGFFEPLDTMPENYLEHITWDSEAKREFKEVQVKILDIYVSEFDRTLNWFFVQLPDGEKGLLYFWIGD